eukprot:2384854-Rhodomonas_salina.1
MHITAERYAYRSSNRRLAHHSKNRHAYHNNLDATCASQQSAPRVSQCLATRRHVVRQSRHAFNVPEVAQTCKKDLLAERVEDRGRFEEEH